MKKCWQDASESPYAMILRSCEGSYNQFKGVSLRINDPSLEWIIVVGMDFGSRYPYKWYTDILLGSWDHKTFLFRSSWWFSLSKGSKLGAVWQLHNDVVLAIFFHKILGFVVATSTLQSLLILCFPSQMLGSTGIRKVPDEDPLPCGGKEKLRDEKFFGWKRVAFEVFIGKTWKDRVGTLPIFSEFSWWTHGMKIVGYRKWWNPPNEYGCSED